MIFVSCMSNDKTKVLNKIKKEHSKFKYRMLSSCNHNIYDSCNMIRFYECIYEYFKYNDAIDETYIRALIGRTNIIDSLYDYYLNHEYVDVTTFEAIDNLLELYIHQL